MAFAATSKLEQHAPCPSDHTSGIVDLGYYASITDEVLATLRPNIQPCVLLSACVPAITCLT